MACSGSPPLETCRASLEGAVHGFAFARGLSAQDGLRAPWSGRVSHPARERRVRGTFRLISKVYGRRLHVERGLVDSGDPAAPGRPDDAVLDVVETPTHPCSPASTSRLSPMSPTATVPVASWTTPSRRCTTLQRPLETRRRRRRALHDEVLAATPTSSAGVASTTDKLSPQPCGSSRTPPKRCPHRSSATSCCGGRRRSRRPDGMPSPGVESIVLVGHPAVDRVLPAAPQPPGAARRCESRCVNFGGPRLVHVCRRRETVALGHRASH